MHGDVMYIDDQMFLVTVTEPMQLTLQTPIKSESANALGMALQSQLQVLRERAFIPMKVTVDPGSGFMSLRTQFPGVLIEPGGARDHVTKVDAKIRRLKETYRSVKAGLPWTLPKTRVKDLVAYSASRMNTRGTSALQGVLSPRVLFTGLKPNYEKEFGLAFGDYVEVHNGMTNTSKERSLPCIALYPVGNAASTWVMWCITTKSYVRRSAWHKMVTNDMVIRTMNSYVGVAVVEAVEEAKEEEDVPDLVDAVEATSDDEDDEYDDMPDLSNPDCDDDTEDDDEPPLRRSERIASGIHPPDKLTLATKIQESSWKEEAKTKAINAEISQLFDELKALEAVKKVPKDAEVLRSHMFVVDKFLANGDFDKTKARIVANGSTQDPAAYPNKSSPTLAVHSLFTVLAFYSALAASYVMAKVDIKGAFVQTPMEGKPVYMRIDKKVTRYIVDLYPLLAEFVQPDGYMFPLLLKAMYGCVQASSLWFKLLNAVLVGAGYVASETDPCVMRREVNGLIFCILIYVDDLLIFASRQEVEALQKLLTDKFKAITMEVVNSVSYLGMEIEWKARSFSVNMDFYVEQLVKDWGQLPVKHNPGRRDSFHLNENAILLTESKRKAFHSMVQRILYVAKRVRMDTLTVVSFLCTRVTKATEEDQVKLEHLLGYFKNTLKKRLNIAGDVLMQVIAFMDAAFALHFDSKKHTGVLVLVGGTVVYVSSRKQKCIAKSPTEAELVGFTDNLGLVELFHEFVSFLLGREAPVPIVFQDCTAVISLVTIGGGITRTKHMRARKNLGKEMVDAKRIMVRYINTKEMMADGLSKILEGEPFQKFASCVLGEMKLTVKTTGGR